MTMTMTTRRCFVIAPLLFVLQLLVHAKPTRAFDYVVAANDATYEITLTDVVTNVSDIPTLFQDANATVHVQGIQ